MEEVYRKDFEAFLEFYEQTSVCPYYFYEKEKLNKLAEDYIGKNQIANDLDFIYFFRYMLKRLVGELDSHSMIRTRDEYERLPIKIDMDDSKFIVNATSEKFRGYLGKAVVKINGAELKKLSSEAENAISYSTEGYRKLETSRFFSHYDPLRALPSISSEAKRIVYVFADGEEVEIKVGEAGFIEPTKLNYETKVVGKHVLLRYTACAESYPGQMHETVNKIKDIILKQNITGLTLDLRGNVGGNDQIIRPLIEFLAACPDLEKQVLVDRAVQSAALFALNDMKKLGAKILGTEIGSSMNHIGNNCRFELPSGKFLTIVATRYFYINEGGDFVTIRTQEEFRRLDKKYVAPKYIQLDGAIPDKMDKMW